MAARTRKEELDVLKAQLSGATTEDPRHTAGARSAPEPADHGTAEAELPDPATGEVRGLCGTARATLERACCTAHRQAGALVIAHPIASIATAFMVGVLLARRWRGSR